MKYWEIIADNLTKAGWSWGYVSGEASSGEIVFIVGAHELRRDVPRLDYARLPRILAMKGAGRGFVRRR
jgi:hypothetical protein